MTAGHTPQQDIDVTRLHATNGSRHKPPGQCKSVRRAVTHDHDTTRGQV
jgi:hypothetical protein